MYAFFLSLDQNLLVFLPLSLCLSFSFFLQFYSLEFFSSMFSQNRQPYRKPSSIGTLF